MNQIYPFKKLCTLVLLMVLAAANGFGQTCTPQGDEATFGGNNVWIGYVYSGQNFNTYKGYVNKGSASSADFDESFGGSSVTYNTNGCSITTNVFSVRYKLRKTFSDYSYRFTVGGDDGYRLSIDGGATWVINNWNEHSYASTTYDVTLNGTYDLVLEYYEANGDNRITFSVATNCIGDGDPTVYGSNMTWIGYVYQGVSFDTYKGYYTKGTGSDMSFDENFGSSSGTFNTSNCSIITDNFSVRYRSRTTFTTGSYTFKVGADDGYRLSLDGGATWVINNWTGHSYTYSTYTANLNGTYNVVLDYYESGGDNRVTFSYTKAVLLPVTLTEWSAKVVNTKDVSLTWKTANAQDFDHFILQRSFDTRNFTDVQVIKAKDEAIASYNFVDRNPNASKVYYRLAMVDIDGSIRLSTIVTAGFNQAEEVKIYPTLVENKQVYIESNKKMDRVLVEVVDMNGRILRAEQRSISAGRQTISLNTSGAGSTAGSYIVRVSNETGLVAKQAVVIR